MTVDTDVNTQPITKIWVGVDNTADLNDIQGTRLNDVPFKIATGKAIPSASSLLAALESLRSRIVVTTKFRTDSRLEQYCYLKIPTTTRWSKIYFKGNCKCIPDNFKPTEEQQLALISSLYFPFTLIQGPPGTGKTETMLMITRVLCCTLNIIGQTRPKFPKNSKKKDHRFYEEEDDYDDKVKTYPSRILISAHSNAALDQMIVELKRNGLDVFRFGMSPSSPEAGELTATGRVIQELSEVAKLIKEDKTLSKDRELDTLLQLISKAASKSIKAFDKLLQNFRDDITDAIDYLESMYTANQVKDLQKIIRILKHSLKPHRELTEEYINGIGLLGCTICGTSGKIKKLKSYNIQTIIIEEAAKILETEMMSFLLLKPKRMIMIGDQAQLTPVVKFDDVRYNGKFNVSLFERLYKSGVRPIQLSYQGRAKTGIANLYRNRYENVLKDLPHVSELPNIGPLDVPVQFINVKCDKREPMTNRAESQAIEDALNILVEYGVDLKQVSVITPYKNQKYVLMNALDEANLHPRDICTADEFQGLQNLVIMVSLVSKSPSVWLRDSRRINVIVSRSRCHFLMFGDLEGFSSTLEWKYVIQEINKVKPAGFFYYDGKKATLPLFSKYRE